MSKIRKYVLIVAAAAFIAGCTPTTEPDDVPEPPRVPHHEQAKGASTGEVVHTYANGLTGSIDKSRKLQTKSELDAVKTAVESYYFENGEYPENLEEMAGYTLGGSDMSGFDYDPVTGKVSLK